MVALPERAQSRLGPLAIAAIVAWGLCLTAIGVRAVVQPQRNSVYPIFAAAGERWQTATPLYEHDPPGLDIYRYAPTVAAFFSVVHRLPAPWGDLLWRGGSVLLLGVGFLAFVRACRPEHLRGFAWLSLSMLPLALPSLNNAQANTMMIGCILLGLAACARERWTLAALCLCVPILFKVYPVAVALLVVLLYPRALGWRLALCLLVGVLLPFGLQDASYASDQYRGWWARLAADDRTTFRLGDGYRDFWLLLNLAGIHPSSAAYAALQLAMAGLVAASVLYALWRRWPDASRLRLVLDLGCLWMVLFGPTTENSTYTLLAPTFALALYDRFGQPLPSRLLVSAALALVVLGSVVTAFPGGRSVAFFMNPLAALLVAIDRGSALARFVPPRAQRQPQPPASTSGVAA